MKITLDPFMHRHLSLADITYLAADLGYVYLELSPRPDSLWFFVQPRAHADSMGQLKQALRETDVQLASLLPLYRWSSPSRMSDGPRCAIGKAPSAHRTSSTCTAHHIPSTWAAMETMHADR